MVLKELIKDSVLPSCVTSHQTLHTSCSTVCLLFLFITSLSLFYFSLLLFAHPFSSLPISYINTELARKLLTNPGQTVSDLPAWKVNIYL